MAPGFPIFISDIIIKNSEALYQALRFPHEPKIQRVILNISSPISAKQYGRKHIEKSRQDWNRHRFNIMKLCIELKLLQNYDRFSEELLNTGNKSIVEYTEKDKVWGAVPDGDFYVGTNALGRLLMELRDSIVQNQFKVMIPEVPDLVLNGKIISEQSLGPVY